jgi:hypothetical protein
VDTDEREAITELYERHAAALRRYALSLTVGAAAHHRGRRVSAHDDLAA